MLNIFYAPGTLLDIRSIRINLTGSMAINSPKSTASHTRLNCSFHPRFFSLQAIIHATGWWSLYLHKMGNPLLLNSNHIQALSKCFKCINWLRLYRNTGSRNHYLMGAETKTSTPHVCSHIQTHTCLQEEHVCLEPGSLIPEYVLLITPLKCLSEVWPSRGSIKTLSSPPPTGTPNYNCLKSNYLS